MIKLVVTDLDGTFLNNQSSFDKELFQSVYARMKEQGIAFAACTGKQCERVEKLFEDVGEGIWILGDSATRIKRDGQLMREFILEQKLAQQAIRSITEFDPQLTIIACTSESAYVHTSIDPAIYDVVKGSYQHVIQTDDLEQIDTPFIKLTVYDPWERSTALRQHIEHSMRGQIYIVDSEARWLDITELHTHKGETVRWLQEMLGVSMAETMSFGDGENDIELMGIAEYSFAVRNACDNTKQAAQFITRSNEENGVLLTIDKMLSLQELRQPLSAEPAK